ncbi:MAG TPA: YggT family protein [Chloroflexota bacterium]|nr:YggT family protein [Chloroflexota bacterium]
MAWTLWLVQFVHLLFTVLVFAVIARALLSWFSLSPSNPLVRILNDVTEPILAPLRRVIPTIGMIDITPIVAILLLQAVQQMLDTVLRTMR